MNYPLLSEYCEAVKYAADNFNELSHLTPVLDTHGNPVMSSGNFAVVFRMHDAKANKDVAVKCFLREQEGRAESYRLIAQELAYTPSPFLTPIRYLDQELFVSSQSTTDEEFPAVVMDWIAGDTLDRYVQAHLSDPNALRLLTFQFSLLAPLATLCPRRLEARQHSGTSRRNFSSRRLRRHVCACHEGHIRPRIG